MLQRERRTTKGADVRRLLTKRMDLWENCAFDTLVQEALRCSESLQKSSLRKSAAQRKRDHEHSTNVFHHLMLQGKLSSAVRWITERDNSRLLSPTDMTKAKTTAGSMGEVSVLDAFSMKYPSPGPSCKEACTPYSAVPNMPALDITELMSRMSHAVSMVLQALVALMPPPGKIGSFSMALGVGDKLGCASCLWCRPTVRRSKCRH